MLGKGDTAAVYNATGIYDPTETGSVFNPLQPLLGTSSVAGNAAIRAKYLTAILRETMTTLEAELAGEHFQRVSRSAILNLRRICEIQTIAPGEHIAVLHDGQRIGITRSLREIEERLRHV
jgi:hypothetical protein